MSCTPLNSQQQGLLSSQSTATRLQGRADAQPRPQQQQLLPQAQTGKVLRAQPPPPRTSAATRPPQELQEWRSRPITTPRTQSGAPSEPQSSYQPQRSLTGTETHLQLYRRHNFLQINLNGIDQQIESKNTREPKYKMLQKQIKRHNVDLVTIQEHHKEDRVGLATVDHLFQQKHSGTQWNLQTKKRETGRGVGIMWDTTRWRLDNSYSLSPRLLVGEFVDCDGVGLTVLSGHFHHNSEKRQ